jgi:hypothetical protein
VKGALPVTSMYSPMLTVVTIIFNGEEELASTIHGNFSPIGANQIEPVIL